MHVPDELLRDGAAAAAVLIEDLALDGAEDGLHIDAVVLVEALVLDRDEGLRNVRRKRRERHARAKFVADLADQRIVAREHERRLWQLNDLPGFAGLVRGVLRGRRHLGGERGDESESA